jgi:murein DD-endopeptidase MepM/ murein hydrolase activator NlpD
MKLSERIFRGGKHYVTSYFGWRNDPISGARKFHNGVDYGTYGKKIPQYALEDGIVESAGTDSSKANFVWVKYPRLAIRLLHYHLDSISVRKGQAVNKNTILGYTGTTGYSTGIHLHLGMKYVGSSPWEDAEKYDYKEAPADPFPNVSDEDLAKRVWTGEFGNKKERKIKLGSRYARVQTLVNQGFGKPEPIKPAPQPTPTPKEDDLLTLVKKTIRGDFGNGEERKNKLGARYNEVQNQVNLNIKNNTTRWDNVKLY